MKKILLLILILSVVFFPALIAQAYTLSGEITGGVFLGGITYVYAVNTEFAGQIPEYYIGLVLLGIGNYSILNVPAGDYVLLAYQDRDFNLLPSADDYFGWYGDFFPEIITVSGNMSGLDIDIAPLPATTITGEVTYSGTQTGLTLFYAATDPGFQNIATFSILLDSTGSGRYTIFAEPGIYYIEAFIDLNLNFTYNIDEPMGYYGYPGDPVAVDVTGGSAENINFAIMDPFSLSITLNPIGAPIVIPAQGGSFQYTINIQNTGGVSATFDAWTDVTLPGGSIYGPILLRTITLV
jgi:hypothetical protein